jgi:hypothetical protein
MLAENKEEIKQSLDNENKSQKLSGPSEEEYKPAMNADFALNKFTFTLLYDHVEKSGMRIAMNEFKINFKNYDNSDPSIPYDYELAAQNQRFSIHSVMKDRI